MFVCVRASGINSPDTALYEGLKLLCSLLVTLVGKGLYGTNGSSSDVRFVDQGILTHTLINIQNLITLMYVFYYYRLLLTFSPSLSLVL